MLQKIVMGFGVGVVWRRLRGRLVVALACRPRCLRLGLASGWSLAALARQLLLRCNRLEGLACRVCASALPLAFRVFRRTVRRLILVPLVSP